ncbi:hypothetical protein UlMin_030158 [Ulmus minor]
MSSQLLEIQPKELKFLFELKKQSSCSVRLSNTTDCYVAFKVKTTSPKRYCVRPNVGVVMPKSTSEFTVTMQVPRTFPNDLECKDKFLIQSTIVSDVTTDEDITASMFVKDGKYVEEKKLKVILISPPNSPTLSPINGTMKQEVDRDASKDHSLSGVGKQHQVSRPLENVKLKPMKDAELKVPVNDVELKAPLNDVDLKAPLNDVDLKAPVNDVDLKVPVNDVDLKAPVNDVDLKVPVYDVDFKAPVYGVDLKWPVQDVELKPVKDVELKLVKDVELEPANNEDFKPVKEEELKTVKEVNELKPKKDVKLKTVDDVEAWSLVKDIEEIKSKLSDLEHKLCKAEVTILDLMEERNSNIEERKKLQEKLAELSKIGVKRVQVGFPLLFVCMVALISLVLGYCLHN